MQKEYQEEFKVAGEELLQKVKELIKEGNARKIIIKNEKEESIMEIPLTIRSCWSDFRAHAGRAIGAMAALLHNCDG